MWRDLRYTVRGLRGSPGFATTAILSLAVGLGASLAVFTVADNLLVRPLPYRDASRLVTLWTAGIKAGGQGDINSMWDYFEWKTQNDVFEGMAVLGQDRSILKDGEQVEEFGKQRVTADLFPLLGVQPVRGRLFTEEEDRAAISGQSVILISHRLWQRWFGGQEDVIGRRVIVDSQPRTIIGVMPANFKFRFTSAAIPSRDTDLWEPLGLNPAAPRTRARSFVCIARLRPGVEIPQARAHMAALAARMAAAAPEFDADLTVQVEPIRDSIFREAKTPLLVLVGAVALMLAVACANVANLLLARYSSRRREMAVRASLGATRWQIVRQLLTESLLLGAVGGITGLMLARWAIAGMLSLAPTQMTQSAEVHIDTRTFLLAVALSMATGTLFGLAPALVTSRLELTRALRGDSRSGLGAGSHLRTWLVGVEIAISVVLLAGAMLLFRSLVGLESVRPGFDSANLLTFRISLPTSRYSTVLLRKQYYERAIRQLEQLPGVERVSAISTLPFTGLANGSFVNVQGRPAAKPGEEAPGLIRMVMPGYFQTLRIPVKKGREFNELDNLEATPRRLIVNEAFVRRHFPNEEPLGKGVNMYFYDPENSFGEIIGVVGDVREGSVGQEPRPTVYYPYVHQRRGASMAVVVRGQGSPLNLAEPARRIVRGLDPAQPISEVRTMEEILGENLARQRFSAWLLSAFSVMALLLAGIGVYGVLAYSVTARTREFGVRTALGADKADIVALVLAKAAQPVVGGLVVGIAAALALTDLLKSLLFGVGPRDLRTFLVAPALLAVVGLVAAYLPARRAASVDPMQALRVE